jgi:hypothetical protein
VSTPQAPPAPAPDCHRWPLFWFSKLECALEAGDLAEAAEAQRQLEGLGLRVEPVAPWDRGARSDS